MIDGPPYVTLTNPWGCVAWVGLTRDKVGKGIVEATEATAAQLLAPLLATTTAPSHHRGLAGASGW
jgi:hypothetical protein